MAKDSRIRLPSGSGGLTRYFEELHSNIEITPGHVIALAVLIALIVIFLHIFGQGWIGG